MKRFLLSVIFLVNANLLSATNPASVNLALRNKLAADNDKSEMMFLLVKGDVNKIHEFVDASGGQFLNSAGDIASIRLSLAAIAQLIEKPFVKTIGSDVHHYKVLNDTMRMRSHVNEVHSGLAPLTQAYTGKGVLLGFIDSGLDYRHPDFKDSTGHTRIKWLWDMTLPDSAAPAPYGYGQEFSGDQIDSGLATAHTGEDEYGHGTHVAGIAAGNGLANGNFKGVAPESDLIVVAYDFISADTVSRMAHAVEYIFNKAQQIGKPCVINASLGDPYGSHDALDLQSQYIGYMINQQPGRVLVAAAGNIGVVYPYHVGRNSVAGDTVFTWAKYNAGYPGVYIQIFSDTADFRNVRWAIGADKVTPYYDFRGKTAFTNVFPSINNVINTSLFNGPRRLGRIQTYTTINEGVYSTEIYILPDTIAYEWRFITTGNGRYDSWTIDWEWQVIPPDSVFPDIIHYHAPDTMQSITSGFTCLDNVITVGNYYNTDRHVDIDTTLQIFPNDRPQYLAENSSRGPTRDGRLKPEITAPGHHIVSAGVLSQIPGLISGQPYKVALGGYHISGGGTSASAPVVSGIAALYLEENPNANWLDVKTALTNCAYQDTFMWGPYPNNAWGYGKVDAFEALTTCSLVNGVKDGNSNHNFYSIYPNPAGSYLNVEAIGKTDIKAVIYDIEGREMLQTEFSINKFSLPLSSMSNGIYILELRSGNESPVMKRFVISR